MYCSSYVLDSYQDPSLIREGMYQIIMKNMYSKHSILHQISVRVDKHRFLTFIFSNIGSTKKKVNNEQ